MSPMAKFGEFVRVELGDTWFNISDFVDWHFHVRLRKEFGMWEVVSMSAGEGNSEDF